MDTGFLNSQHDFGINAPPKDRILYRRMTTCAPIYDLDFSSLYNDSVKGETLLIYAGNNGPISNYTFKYVLHAQLDGVGYMLR
jgi:hypothetical protein